MVQKEVHEYLKSGTEKGFSLKELKRELIKAGHEIKIVEEAAKEFERKNAFKIISAFGIVIIVSLVVIFGFKDLIFNEKNVVGVNLDTNSDLCNNWELKDCSSIDSNVGFKVCQNNKYSECINNNFNECKINDKGYGLCCIRNNKLTDCSNEQYLNKNEFVVFRINLKDFVKDKVNEKFYKECTYSYLREKKEDKVERREYCADNIERDKNFLIDLKGFLPEENLNLINIYLLNKKNLTDLFNLGVNVK